VLRAEGVPVALEDGDALTVTGRPPADVGRRAFAAGIELHELRAETSGLEEIYFKLTAGQEQFAAGRSTAPKEGPR
jgi:ABC-2 type transport system ATP-binding protein